MAEAVLERVSAALQEGRFGEVAGLLDEAELASPSPTVLQDGWPAAVHLLAHLYNDNLADARMLYKRLSDAAKAADPQVAPAWRLVQCAWQGAGEAAWAALRAHAWSGPAAPLAAALAAKLRASQLDLVAAAYSFITPGRLAALCGCSEAEAAAAAAERGWRAAADGSGAWEVVAPPGQRAEVDSFACLEALSEYMMQLEGPV